MNSTQLFPASPVQMNMSGRIDVEDLRRVKANAIDWLYASGVIRPNGAVVAWLAPDDPQRQFVSAEIAGYACSFFCWIGDSETALRIAHWMRVTAQDEAGAFRCRWHSSSSPAFEFRHDSSIRWIFDTGIVLKGLTDTYRVTGLPELKDAIANALQFLKRSCSGDEQFPGRWDIAQQNAFDDPARWSAQPGSYHAKVERAVTAAALILNDTPALDAVSKRANHYIQRYQQADGRFVTYPATGGTHAHPHLYTCEGLWDIGQVFRNEDWIHAAARGVEWIAHAADAHGRFPRTLLDGVSNYWGRGDAAAQFLRLLVAFDAQTPLKEQALLRLLEFASAEGGFVFGWNSDGSLNYHADTWGTIAAIQALSWYLGETRPRGDELI